MKTNRFLSWQLFVPAMLLIIASPKFVFAHTGIGGTSGLWDGLTHPITGLDHICAMVGVGLWAAQRGGRSIWLIPLAFLTVMAIGGVLGTMAVSIPFVERGIVASVLILGILIAATIRLPLLASVLIVGAFALFHGHAHGAEMLHTASGLLYGIGFLLTTALLHLVGIAIGWFAKQSAATWIPRYAGVAIVLCGLYLATAI